MRAASTIIHYVEDAGLYNNELLDFTKLIKYCEFKLDNPYDLNIDIINDHPELPLFLLKEFKIQTWKSWANYVYVGETTVMDLYNVFFEIFKSNQHRYFANLSENEKYEIHQFLDETVAEEKKHSNLVEYLFEKCNYNFTKITKDSAYEKLINDMVSEKNLLQSMFFANMGECQILTALSLIIRHTANEDKRNYLKIILQEESKHFNGFTKLMKLIRKNITDDEIIQLDNFYRKENMLHLEYLGTSDIHNFFHYCKKNLLHCDPQNNNVAGKIWKSIQDNKFQQEHYSLFTRKFYLYYSILFPDVSEIEYNLDTRNMLESMIKNYEWDPNTEKDIV